MPAGAKENFPGCRILQACYNAPGEACWIPECGLRLVFLFVMLTVALTLWIEDRIMKCNTYVPATESKEQFFFERFQSDWEEILMCDNSNQT